MTADDATTDLRALTVGHVMSTDPLVLRDDMRVEVAAAMLADHGYAGAPVVDERGRLSGVLHALDVALAHLPPQAEQARPVVVRSLLRPPVTVEPTSPIHVAAERMRSSGTDRLVVVERQVRVVGLVTGQDLLRTVALHGDLLRRTIDERIAALGITGVVADVTSGGEVFLSGAVDSIATRDRLVRTVGAIGGVTGIEELITVRRPRPS
jgi:CBS domain-containing protein